MIARYMPLVSTLLLLASGFSVGGDKKDDKDKLQGEWAVVSMKFLGKERDPDAVKMMKPLVIKGSEWTAPSGGKFTFKIDPTKSPKELDLVREEKGKEATWRGIYKIESDTVTFCRSAGSNGERPKEFKGGEGVVLFVFKRSGK